VRLSNAIAAGGDLVPLLDALKTCQVSRDELTAALVARESFDVQRFDRKAIQAKVEEHVNRWRALLTNHFEDGRRLLREVLAGPLRLTPERKAYRFEGEAAIGRLFAGAAGVAPFVASPRGTVKGYILKFSGLQRDPQTPMPVLSSPVGRRTALETSWDEPHAAGRWRLALLTSVLLTNVDTISGRSDWPLV
jgi:hypothetical protein